MKRRFCVILVVLMMALCGCATAYHTYRSDIWDGKKLLAAGDYAQAREDFTKAIAAEPDETGAYAFAATASYKMNDLNAASRFIQGPARPRGSDDVGIRVMGYKALIQLKEGRKKEGLDSLHTYIVAYKDEYGVDNVRGVQAMWRKGEVDLPALETMIDEQIRVYESDMEQYRSAGTGWFSQKYGTPVVSPGR
jgi:tetratricopeptide (TPR) repeat protein